MWRHVVVGGRQSLASTPFAAPTLARPFLRARSTVVQELLVQQHFIRWDKAYQYNEVRALADDSTA
mgnify:CR=1 FL=1